MTSSRCRVYERSVYYWAGRKKTALGMSDGDFWTDQWASTSQWLREKNSLINAVNLCLAAYRPRTVNLLYLSVGCRTGIETLGSPPVPSVYDQHFPCYHHRLLIVSATSSQQRFFPWLPLCEQDSQSLVSSSYRCWAWLRSVWEARCHRGDRGQMWLA